jgi:hypothetical protein
MGLRELFVWQPLENRNKLRDVNPNKGLMYDPPKVLYIILTVKLYLHNVIFYNRIESSMALVFKIVLR